VVLPGQDVLSDEVLAVSARSTNWVGRVMRS
jgi:hypothetical protein